MSQAPILIIAYNKPDLLEGMLQKILALPRCSIYIHLDGPQETDSSRRINQECQAVITAFENSYGKVNKSIKSFNLGGKDGVLSAIDWFFLSEDFGIILEEDIDFNAEIFKFVEFGYKFMVEDKNLFALCFFNPVMNLDSNFYLNHWLPWGWATSAVQWKSIRSEIKSVNLTISKGYRRHPSKRLSVRHYLNSIIRKVDSGEIKTWDAQVHALVIKHNKFVLFPKQSLTKHLGVRPDATHADLIDWWAHIPMGVFSSTLPEPLNDKLNRNFERVWRMDLLSMASNYLHLFVHKMNLILHHKILKSQKGKRGIS
jgi:hypothetical protein